MLRYSAMHVQLADRKLKDTKGGYAQFLRENKSEAKVMEDKEKRVKEIEQSTIKAKSKVQYSMTPCSYLTMLFAACLLCTFSAKKLIPQHCLSCSALHQSCCRDTATLVQTSSHESHL